ncbi:dual oxidase 1-like [Gigantopelta aegis]|uniref:dual oxidase 1-like n=1 Tax=Gigantopelta aegis TaxID=1735272 RepID=UPI001B88894B|nr:dual oxidase 1-like [Gigantopelta aegis]
MSHIGILLLWHLCSLTGPFAQQTNDPELHPQNGFYNNLFQPDWGAAGSLLLRLSPPDYSDRVFESAGGTRPNPLDISEKIHKGVDGLGSLRGRNALLAFFGQLVVDEIVDSRRPGCPPEYIDLPIPEGHPYRRTADNMMFQRTGYSARTGTSPNVPRQQQNGVTPFLDAEFLYGNSRMWTNIMREFKGGRLKSVVQRADGKDSFPVGNEDGLPLLNPPIPRDNSMKPVGRFLEIGNTRGHENPFLLSLQVIWFRWHNIVASNISLANSGWSDNKVFDQAKKLVTAHFQNIVMYEWLPAYLQISGGNFTPGNNLIPAYEKYDSTVQPGISQEFATAAMRYGHTLVPSGVWLMNETCSNLTTTGRGPDGKTRPVTGLRMCNTYWDSQGLVRDNFDPIVRGLVYTLSEREDADYTADIREYLYGPLHFSRRDLAALDIQRGRDHGLPDYNTVRETLGLKPITDWREINNDSSALGVNQKIRDLQILYGNTTSPDNLDLITGGMLESNGFGPGKTFQLIIKEQFLRIRNGDRLWYENNIGSNRRFTAQELVDVKSVNFRQILAATTNIPLSELPPNVFICAGGLACSCRPPLATDDTNSTQLDVCSPLSTFDYFTDSRLSFPLSIVALGLVIPGSILLLVLLIKRRQRINQSNNQRQSLRRKEANPNKFVVKEWTGPESGTRNVVVEFNSARKKISVSDLRGKSLRFIDLRNVNKATLKISYDKDLDLVCFRIPGEVDLILRFSNMLARQELIAATARFLEELGIQVERQEQPEQVILDHSKNMDTRQQLLDRFFRVICLQALKEDPTARNYDLDEEEANEIISIKLTRTELADALGLQPSSVFVRNIFLLTDKDSDGFISFREFLDLFVTFAAGSADDKSRLMFNIYDIRKRGYLTRSDFYKMIKSMLDISGANLDDARVNELIDVMFQSAGVSDQDRMSYEDFRKVFASSEYKSTLQAASLVEGLKAAPGQSEVLRNRRKTVYKSYRGKGNREAPANRRSKIEVSVKRASYPESAMSLRWDAFSRYVEIYQLHIFWLTLYTLVCIGIFVERAYYYAVGREHAGLRRVSGAWTTAMIRGSASVIMFTYAGLLVTMCRNIITRLRETFMHRFIPFDSAVTFHKYIAWVAMVATIVHIFGHFVNLYCMSTQTPQALTCLFREYFTPSHVLRTFHYWAWQTITGLAGIYVTALIFIMYVFATQWARRHVFTWFWFTHNFYIFVYIITFLHGIGALVQSPLFQWFMVGPLVLFMLDKLASASRNKLEIPVKKAELLPSAVIGLTFKRPENFQYLSGQWVRIACLDLGKSEYHPFTLTSAPHEKYLSLHIRAVGPWTKNLRSIYEPNQLGAKPYPKLYVDGPFGEGHQDWFTFDVAVLVGGGIGVTPFASILKDIAFKSRTGAHISCQKVYFLWVTRTQKHYEWLIDIIRDVENTDDRDIVSVHIFVTQFQQKYDLRTTMLYICERHFQRVEGRSLFTGLKATTHFGRPYFNSFLQSLQFEHPQVQRIGVFSCGPGPMTRSVQDACSHLNARDGPTYIHHFENF